MTVDDGREMGAHPALRHLYVMSWQFCCKQFSTANQSLTFAFTFPVIQR